MGELDGQDGGAAPAADAPVGAPVGTGESGLQQADLDEQDRRDRSLRALDRTAPALCRRLRLGAQPGVVERRAGEAVVSRGGGFVRLGLSPAARAAALARAAEPSEPSEPILVMGVGDGSLIVDLLQAGHSLTAWEPDPSVLWHLLGAVELEAALGSGALRLLLGPDLLRVRGRPARDLVHPVVEHSHGPQLLALRARPEAPVALVCSGGLFVTDLCAALEAQGWLPWVIETSGIALEELTYALQLSAAKLVARINTMQGLTDLCNSVGVPLLVWEIDPCLDHILPPKRPAPRAWIFTYREQNVRSYRSRGHLNVEHLALAAPPHRRPLTAEEMADPRWLPADGLGWETGLSFVGGSLLPKVQNYVDAAKELTAAYLVKLGRPAEAAPILLDQLVAIQRQDFDQWRLPALLDGALPGLRDLVRRERGGVDLALWLGELVAAERRLSHVSALGPLGVQVWGDAGWQRIHGGGVVYRGFAGHLHQLTRIYNGARVHIDINRIYQRDIITMRVFDVLASGGFLLAERSPGLERCFVIGKEIETWRTQAELVAKARHYLAHPEAARRIAEAGRARVLRDHQFDDRVRHMLRVMGLSQPSP